jgi:transketolase
MTPPTILAPPELDELCINTLRFLAVDMGQKAKSGYSGLPLGTASMAGDGAFLTREDAVQAA